MIENFARFNTTIWTNIPRPAQWAFRWLYNQPEVTCVLSGMNSIEMVEENITTASTTSIGSLGPEEEAMLQNVVTAINARMEVGCTGIQNSKKICRDF